MGVKRDKLGPKFHPEKRGKTYHIDDWFISGLPDGVLIMILSLLPLREAARTSVLSSRWTNLWRHSLRLNFVADEALHDRLSYNEEGYKYINWVNSVVQSHKAPKLEEFRVYFHLDKSFEEAITAWLEFAFARKVQELELSLLHNCDFHRSNSNHARYGFPDELLRKKRGRKAPLDRFKSLKDLCLRAVNVSGEHIGFFIGNCPFLERLIVQGSRIMSKVEVCGTSLALKHLEIFDCHPSGLPIKISAPNLISLKVEKLSGLLLENVPLLVEFNLTRGYSDLYDNKLIHVLHCCIYQLDILTVDLVYFKKLEYCVFPQMPKLKKLKIIKYALLSHENHVVFSSFLKAFPHLQEFEVEIMGTMYTCINHIEDENSVMHFSHQHLKVLKLSGYFGYSQEIEFIKEVCEFVKCISENCTALEKIMVVPYYIERNPHMPRMPEALIREQKARSNYEKQQLEPHVPQHIEFIFL